MSASKSLAAVNLTAAITLILTIGAAAPASAQGLLKQLAREAALRAAAGALVSEPGKPSDPTSAVTQDAPTSDAADEATDAAETGGPAGTGPDPWPINVGASNVRAPGQLKFSADLEKRKADFIEWSRVSCTACEGGRHYDAWAQHFIRTDGSWRAWEKMLGALAVGESVTWKGRSANGRIRVVSETPIAPWACKQLEWSLTRGAESVSRPGLICRGHGDDRSGSTTWTTVF